MVKRGQIKNLNYSWVLMKLNISTIIWSSSVILIHFSGYFDFCLSSIYLRAYSEIFATEPNLIFSFVYMIFFLFCFPDSKFIFSIIGSCITTNSLILSQSLSACHHINFFKKIVFLVLFEYI